ncbi:MAG: helix-hairpin-helix domain-containing protein [Salibacteraceae bacterium]
MKRLVVFFHLIFMAYMTFAQENEIEEDREAAFDQIIELVSENLEAEGLDFTTLLEDLNYFFEHPLNLNRADRNEFRRLGFLSEIQIEAIIRHRDETGRIMTELELQGIEELDMEIIRAILPFVRVSGGYDVKRITWSGLKEEASHEAFIRYQRVIEPMEGYKPISEEELAENPNRRYFGSPERIYARYRFRYLKNISAGITMEKDAGEAFFGSTQPKGFDYYSAHFYIAERGFLKKAIIGDYQAQFGQGLTFWSGLAFGKSADIASIKRSARGITPYVSADENNFMRGAATTLAFGPVEFTSFFSYKNVDATIITPDTLDLEDGALVSQFSSFQLSGIHGTSNQLAGKDAISEMNTGGHLRYERPGISLGLTGIYTQYGGDYTPSVQLYRSLEPINNSFFIGGFDYQLLYKNIMVFGENSLRLDGGTAFLNGAMISLDRNFDISLFHRDFSPQYSNLRSNAVSESSRNVNEKGLYIGSSAKFGSRWKLTGYFDVFRFPWMRFRTDAPSEGKEYLTQLEYRASRRFKVYARYRMEEKFENINESEQAIRPIGSLTRQWYRFNLSYDVSKTFSIRNRVELTHVNLSNGTTENGWLIYQDIIWKPQWPAKYQLKLRYTMFDTESYQSRIYAYENDVLYSFSVPAYYHRGNRAYLIFGYDISRWSDLTIRFAQTFYANRETSGSGLNTIDGPTRSEVKVQYRVKF